MCKDRGETLQGHHDDGQSDASEGKYNRPHNITIIDDIVLSRNEVKQMHEDNQAYRDGYENGKKQR